MTPQPPFLASPPPAVAPGTPVHTRWGWVTAWIPVASLVLTVVLLWVAGAWMLDWFQRLAFLIVAQQRDPGVGDPALMSGMLGTMTPFLAASAMGSLLSWALVALGVVAAYLDYADLGRLGYPRRFHWAWSFLGAVYPIGRAVVVHRQAGAGWATMWIAIAAVAGSLVASMTWSVWLLFALLQTMPAFTGTVA